MVDKFARRPIVTDDLGPEALRIFGALRAFPLTRRMEAPMARRMREALASNLRLAVIEAKREGAAPIRTGRGYKETLRGARAFGTRFGSLRGVIVGPSYMAAHDAGATITKQSKYLTVPLPAALRPDGTPKLPGARSWSVHGSFVYTARTSGKKFIARKTKEGRLEFLYILMDEVTLRAHKGWLTNSWQEQQVVLLAEWGSILVEEIAKQNITSFINAGSRAGRRIR